MRRGRRCAAALVLAAASCGGDGDADDVLSRVASMVDAAPPEQAAALADGVVTVDEARALVAEVAECMQARGVDVSRADLAVDPNTAALALDLQYAAPDADERALQLLDEIEKACKDRFILPSFEVYALQNMPTRAEQTEFARRLVDCLRAMGVTVAPGDAGEALAEAQVEHGGEYGACMQQVEATR